MSDGVKKQEPIYTRGPFMLFVGPIFTDGLRVVMNAGGTCPLDRKVRGTRVPNPLYKVSR